MSAPQTESRKRHKKWHGGGGQFKRGRGSRELEVGMKGVLLSCNMNQKKCTSEAYDLLNEYADQLFGPQGDTEGSAGCEDFEEEDVDVALKKEVAQLKSTKQEPRFKAMDSGANNIVFIRTHDIDSDKLIHHIFSDLLVTKKKKTRHVLRMLPVTGTCRAYMEDIVKFMTDFLQPWFQEPNHATYKIAFKARNSTHSKRDDVLNTVAGLVGRMNPQNKVNLSNPELTIIMEVIKTVCCVSVVRDFMAFRKYNIQELVKDPTEAPSRCEEDPKRGEVESEVKAEDAAGSEDLSVENGNKLPEKEEAAKDQ